MGRWEAVCRTCRRLGTKLYLKGQKCYTSKCPFERRRYPPGQHGRTRRRQRLSEYGKRLFEKQKLKKFYFMTEEQFRRFFEMALKERGNTGQKLIELLERRLDNVVYRAGFALSRRHARQLVVHGHIRVNGQKVDRPSYIVDLGDEIELSEKINLPEIDVRPPGWLEVSGRKAKVIRMPTKHDLGINIDENLIVEFYSR